MKLVVLEVLRSYLNVFFREKDKAKYDVIIVKIPRRVMSGPNESVAISVTFFPRTPTKTELKIAYKIIGIVLPIMIAFLRSFSCPFISLRSSGIATKPSKAKRITPMGFVKLELFHVIRFEVSIEGRNLTNIPKIITMIPRTPHVSSFFKFLNPFFSNRVIIIQKKNPMNIGFISPGSILEMLSPSPIRYAKSAEYIPNIIAKNIVYFPHFPKYFFA